MQLDRLRWAAVLAAAFALAACSGGDEGDDAVTVATAAPTTAVVSPATVLSTTVPSTTAPTTTAPPVDEPTATTATTAPAPPSEFAPAPASCLERPAILDGFPDSDFVVLTEDRIFECLGITAFQSEVVFDGRLPTGPTSLVATSTQRLDGGVISVESEFFEGGVLIEEVIRVGGDIWVRDTDGTWVPGSESPVALFNEVAELRLAGSGALFALAAYAGGAERVGEVELGGRSLVAWEADAQAIADHVNSLGFVPVPIGVNDGFVRLWTTPDGLVVKLEGDLRASDVTLAGLPVDQLDPESLGLPPDAFAIVPDYSVSYELFAFDHDVVIEPPELG